MWCPLLTQDLEISAQISAILTLLLCWKERRKLFGPREILSIMVLMAEQFELLERHT